MPLATKLMPDLAGAVDSEINSPGVFNDRQQLLIAFRSLTAKLWVLYLGTEVRRLRQLEEENLRLTEIVH